MGLQGPYQILWEGTHTGARCRFSEYRRVEAASLPYHAYPTAGLR